jgi:hypothetical protein
MILGKAVTRGEGQMVKALVLLLLTGCAQIEPIVAQLPTAKYCSDVLYQRSGDSVTIAAVCKAPFGGM